MTAPTLSTRARILVDGSHHQSVYSGYGITVGRCEGGYLVTSGATEVFAHSSDAAERACLRLLEQRADESVDEAPERVRWPVGASGVQL